MTPLLFLARPLPGFQLDAARDPRVRLVRKRALRVSVHFATAAATLATPEGRIAVSPGDAIVDDGDGRRWAVERVRFDARYTPLPPVQSGEPGPYESLPCKALAMQMAKPFRVRFTDGLSELEGHAGDWLLDYGDGSLGVVAADVFTNSYDLA